MSRRSNWGSAMEQENAVRRQQLHKYLQSFIGDLVGQVASLPLPDYRRIESDYIAIGWNLITRRVFVYQAYGWTPSGGIFGGEEAVKGYPGTTMLLGIDLDDPPGHVSQLVIPRRISDIVPGAVTFYDVAPIIEELRSIRNTWRPPAVQQLYYEHGADPLKSLWSAHELVMDPPRRYLVDDGDTPWRT